MTCKWTTHIINLSQGMLEVWNRQLFLGIENEMGWEGQIFVVNNNFDIFFYIFWKIEIQLKLQFLKMEKNK